MTTDVKAAVDQMLQANAEFQRANDERLAKIEKGMPDPLMEEKVDRILAAEGKHKDALNELRVDISARVDSFEEMVARAVAGAPSEDASQERAYAKQFFAHTSGKPVDEVEVGTGEIQAYRDYKQAFVKYARKGDRRADVMAALSVGSDPDGGYWVEPDMTGRIVQLIYDTSPIRPIVNVQPTGKDEITGMNDLDEAAAAWAGETETPTTTATPTIGEWRIRVHKQYALPKASQDLLDDADVDVEGWLTAKIADKFVRAENLAFVTGNGVNKPRGFASYTTSTSDPSKANWGVPKHIVTGHATAFLADPNVLDPFIDVIHDLKAEYRQGAVWTMNRSTLGTIRKAQTSQGEYQLIPDGRGSVVGNLLNFPVVELEDMADTGASNLSVAFGDFRRAYTIADRLGMTMLRDPFTAKPYVVFYSTKRVGGDIVDFDAIRFLKHST